VELNVLGCAGLGDGGPLGGTGLYRAEKSGTLPLVALFKGFQLLLLSLLQF
jgi:hypothetical protein